MKTLKLAIILALVALAVITQTVQGQPAIKVTIVPAIPTSHTIVETPTPEPSATPTLTDTPSATHTPTDTPTVTHTPTQEPPTSTLTATDTVTFTPTPSSTPTETVTETPTADTATPITETPDGTLVTEEATEAATAGATESATITLTPTSSLSPTPSIPTVKLKGVVVFQNRKSNVGIAVTVLTYQNKVVSQGVTDAKGNYTVDVPVRASYWLVYSAPLHLTTKVLIQPKSKITKIILKGGDIDQDGCIGTNDLGLITSSFEKKVVAADITGDGVVNARDLAILAGNFNADCGPAPTATPQATEVATATETPLATDVATESPTLTNPSPDSATVAATEGS